MSNPFAAIGQALSGLGQRFGGGGGAPPAPGGGNPFSGLGQAFMARLGGGPMVRHQERQRQQEAMNPLREQVLQMLQGQPQPFAGGPMSELTGQPQPQAQPGMDPAGAQTMPVEPPPPMGAEAAIADREALPRDLRPPPEIDRSLTAAARRQGVPVNALRVLAAQESSFRPGVVGQTPIDLPGQEGDRARGLFQFTPQEIERVRRDVRPDFDPMNPDHAAEETARRLRIAMDQGKDIVQAMTEHFGGPDPRLHGPRTRRYREEVSEKLQRADAAAGVQSNMGGMPGTEQGPGMPEQPPGAPGSVQMAPGQQAGPFGTVLDPPRAEQNPVHALLAAAASDPSSFAEMFAGEGGVERLMGMLGGGPAEAVEQTRVISGDSAQGRSMGLQAGERARVKGQVTPSGEFLPSEVVAQPFDRPGEAATGGPMINLYDTENDEIRTFRRDDPEVDRLIREQAGMVTIPDGQALEQIRGMTRGERERLTAAHSNARKLVETAADALDLIQDNPDINTFVARGAALINDVRADVKSFASALGREFDESVFDVSVHDDTFRRVGIENRRLQSLITSLAFQRAAAEAGVGRITNRMVQQFIQEIGGDARDPVTLATLIADTARRGARGFVIDWETHTGSEFTGDLGLERIPDQFQFGQQFPPGEGGLPGAAAGLEPDEDGVLMMPDNDDEAERIFDDLPSGTEFILPSDPPGTVRRKN